MTDEEKEDKQLRKLVSDRIFEILTSDKKIPWDDKNKILLPIKGPK